MDQVYLMGSEDVLHASHQMKEAAGEMTRASNQMWEAMVMFRELVEQLEYLQAKKDE